MGTFCIPLYLRRVKKFCYCLPLRTGAKITFILTLMYAAIFVACAALQLYVGLRSCDLGTNHNSKGWMYKVKDTYFEVMMGIMLLFVSLAYFVAGLFLLEGLLTNNSKNIFIWRIMTFICSAGVIFVALGILFFIGIYKRQCTENEAKIVSLWIVIRVPFLPSLLLLLVYFYIAMDSYTVELDRRVTGPRSGRLGT